MESLNIAIIGSRGVGKSSFVQRVLGLSRPPISESSSLRMVIDNRNYSVTLLELDLEHFDITADQPIQWPKQINGHILPRVDGALILYDVTNRETTVDLPRTLSTCCCYPFCSVLCLYSGSLRAYCISSGRCIGLAAHTVARPHSPALYTRPLLPERKHANLGARCNSRFDEFRPALDPRGVQVRCRRQRQADRRRRHGQSGPLQGVCGQLQHLVQ